MLFINSHGYDLELNPLASSFKHQWVTLNRTYPHFGSTTSGMSSIVWWHTLVKVVLKVLIVEDNFYCDVEHI